MSFTNVDLPEPDTPVTETKQPSGISTSIFFKLCSLAPLMVTQSPLGVLRSCGVEINRFPEMYWPVMDSLFFLNCETEPEWTITPPCSPAPGPISTMWSATQIVSSSCSTTRTLLPISLSLSRVSINLLLSRWCNPIDGSSKT